jgi:hypothetical protein
VRSQLTLADPLAPFPPKVRPYYNPSLGWWLKDLALVSYMYISTPTKDPVVTGLADHLNQVGHTGNDHHHQYYYHLHHHHRHCCCWVSSNHHHPFCALQVLQEVGPTGRVVHLAHSGGALLTYLVAKYHLKYVRRSCLGMARSCLRPFIPFAGCCLPFVLTYLVAKYHLKYVRPHNLWLSYPHFLPSIPLCILHFFRSSPASCSPHDSCWSEVYDIHPPSIHRTFDHLLLV